MAAWRYPLCGDLDGDVDVRDFRLILGALASKSYTARADYNSDGRVDARDLGIWVRCELELKFGRFVPGAD